MYNNTLATIIPWTFWFSTGYVSHITPYADQYLEAASVLTFIGLLGPVGVAYWLISRDSELWTDVLRRFFNILNPSSSSKK
ncbi:MAG: hypothetical protein ACUBOA_09915 [Candidatus Loosdrechtia sp.]|uniref:hypothetical protein n=1 Tax=Candidatus Loosdrechtia sp. TaxID=3101272 RepID=UPI003A74651E|nr:MAG: hypothetical protein QY305_03360 [Candidatus Jettenia sp. AMX2]